MNSQDESDISLLSVYLFAYLVVTYDEIAIFAGRNNKLLLRRAVINYFTSSQI